MVVCPLRIWYESADPNAFNEITTKFYCRGPEDCTFTLKFRSMYQYINEGFTDHTIETLTVTMDNFLVYIIRFQVTTTTPAHINYYVSVNKITKIHI